MTRAADHPPRETPRARPIPLEATDGPWLSRCRKTLVALILRPARSFDVCPEPIDHGRVMRLLATLRLPPWIALLVALALAHNAVAEGAGPPVRAIYVLIEPSLAQVLSLWIVLMIPVGLPLLYFVSGLVAHVGVALTGGASRSIGASMRACGYVLGLALLVVGVVDIPLYLGQMPGIVYLAVLGGTALVYWALVAVALSRTHRAAGWRGGMAAVMPTAVFVAATFARAMLELSEIPGLPPPGNGYMVGP